MRDENIQLRERFLQRFFSLSLSLLSKGRGVRDDDSSGFVDSRLTLSFLSFSLFLRTQQNASSSSSASSPKRGDAIDDAKYAVPVLVTSSSSSSSSDRRTTERVYRNAAHKDHLLRGFPFPNDECKTLGDIWESAFKKYPNKAFLG